MRGFLLTGRCFGVDHDRMLELEEFVAMDEGGGIGSHAVVRATPWHEVQLAGHAWGSTLQEVLHQCDAGFGREWSAEELRLGDEIRQLRRWILRTRPIAVIRGTQFRPELPRLREGHLLGR